MYCDGHIHILPAMDNGPVSVHDSVAMLRMLRESNVHRLVITPHYYADRESCNSFLLRRKYRYQELLRAARSASVPMLPCLLSAEVEFSRGISKEPLLEKLMVPKTRYLPMNFSLGKIDRWIVAELAYMMHKRKIYPIICNMERHMIYDHPKDYETIASFPYAVYQIGINAMKDIHISHAVFRLIRSGKTVICGSNAHDPFRRPPVTAHLQEQIIELHGYSVYKTLTLRTNAFFNEAFS